MDDDEDLEEGISAELAKLSALLADVDLRRAFYMDPDGTMAKQGVGVGLIPPGLLNMLKGLSHLELGVVSRANLKLLEMTEDQLRLIVMFPV